ncbi:InlB B-repeat-containing protein, partial [Paenibacillus albidus]|uniref:InlB B-repeat-containing protein n=1 Tax=Paenibacillus albidus TaxID=2041023 RepID=UPI001665FD71
MVSWNWVERDSNTENSLYDVTYGNNTYVAVGEAGTIVTSSDGVNWTERTSSATNQLWGVAYGNKKFVAVGLNSAIYISDDGVTWTDRTFGETHYGVTYGNGMFVAVGFGREILTSIDGVSWTQRSLGDLNELRGVTYGNGIFTAVGFGGKIWTSSNGESWTSRTSGVENDLWSISYGNGKFVAVGAGTTILTSVDGLSWTKLPPPSGAYDFYKVTYGNDTFVAVGLNGSVFTSADGLSWTSRSPFILNVSQYGVTYGNGTFVILAESGKIRQSVITETYNVAFDTGEGSKVESRTDVISGTTIVPPTDPTRSGYTFGGWYNGEGYDTPWNFSTDKVTSDITLYAKWTEQMYTVTFDSRGGNVVADITGLRQGGMIVAPAEPTKAGFIFGGWYKDAGLVTKWDFSVDIVRGDITLYAKWTPTPVYTVTFDSMVGIEVPKVSGVISGSKISAPVSPSRCGFTLEGWYTDASYVSIWDFNSDPVTGDITLYAKWTSDASTCSVTFDSHGGSATDSVINLRTGSTITAPAAPTRTGFNFAGWYKETSYTTQWNFSSDTVMAHITLHAKWKAMINQWSWVTRPVTAADFQGITYGNNRFVAVGRSGAIATSIDGVSWTSYPQNSSLSLHSVTYGNGTFVAVDFDKILTSSDGISWASHAYNTSFYSVAFGKGKFVGVGFGGDIMTSIDGETWTRRTSGTSNTLQDVIYGNSQFAAVGDDGAVLTSTDGDNWVIKSHIPVQAQGIAYGDGIYVVVGFDGQIWMTPDFSSWTGPDTAEQYEILDVTYGDGVFVAAYATGALISRDGENWTKLSDVNGYFMDVVYGNGSFILVGYFGSIVQSIASTSYTVTFDSQGGSFVGSVTGVSSGATITAPVDPTKRNYTFAGWYKEASYDTAWDFGRDTVTENTMLYAKWTADPAPTYSVTFNTQGGSFVGSVTGVSSGATITAPVDPTRSGYTFAGWYKEATYDTLWNYGTDTVIANTILYAKWTADPAPSYTVNFDSQGGSAVTSVAGVSSGATITAPTDPTRSGYTFAGWYKEASYATPWNYGTDTVTENTTLYAKWTAIPADTYTVTFNTQGGSLITTRYGVSSGATISAPTDPTKSGYTFGGWYKEAGVITPWNFSADTVTTSITLYAKWTVDPAPKYTVSFDSQGGSTVTDITYVSSGATITAPAEPTKSGYTFAGWYKEASYVTPWNFSTDTVTADSTLYAKWTAVPSSGGSGGDSGGSGGSAPIPPNNSKVISKDSVISLPAGKNGEVHLGDEIMIEIPANATEQDLILTIKKVLETQSLLQNNEVPVSPIFEILKNSPGNFNKPVTLTLVFEPASLKEGQLPAVFYFDEAMRKWVKVGGIIKGNQMIVEVDHLGKYAVLAVDQ